MNPTPIFRRLSSILPGLVLVLSLAVAIYNPGGTASFLQDQVFDAYQRILPRKAAEDGPHAVYVDIDAATVTRYGAWPWPRKRMLELVEAVRDAGASAILIDAPLTATDPTSADELLKLWAPDTGDAAETALRAMLAALPDQDAAFARLLAETPSIVSFMPGYSPNGVSHEPLGAKPVQPVGSNPRFYLKPFKQWHTTLDTFERSAKGEGATLAASTTGYVRSLPMLVALNEKVFPSNVLEALRVERGGAGYRAHVEESPTGFAIGMEPGISRITIDGAHLAVPTNTAGELRLYFGGPETRAATPAWKLLADDVNRPTLIGRIAIIGLSVNGVDHLYATPGGGRLASGAIAANAIDQILDRSFLTRPGWAPAAEQVFILLGGLIVVLAINRFRFRWGFTVALLLTLGAAYGSFHLFQTHRWLVDPALPAVTLFTAAVIAALMRRLHTEDITRFIETQFARRLSSAGLAKVRANPSMIQAEGELRDISSLVVGLRGFNIIADRYLQDPKAYADILNRFFTPMVKIVQDRNGMADRSVGDTLYAVWNAPLSASDHASKACDAALRMVENLEALNEFLDQDARRQNLSHVPLSLSIGIDSGTAIIGNMGAIQRFDYGVLGEPVSFAAYLQKHAREYGPAIIVGEGAQRIIGSRYALLEIDLVSTPRHPEGRRVFALLGDPIMRANPKFRALQEAHGRIFAAYRSQNWDEARAAIAETRTLNGALSTLYDFYEARIEGYQATPPGSYWNGTWFAGRL